ncbi:hypothetical protein [Nostoc sp.]|uniref:hypothetical protein n=1 Tax=Nostoc sp. TaxID=1180 RepID=UPI002FF60104
MINTALAGFHVKPWDSRLNGKEGKKPEQDCSFYRQNSQLLLKVNLTSRPNKHQGIANQSAHLVIKCVNNSRQTY